MNCAAVQERLSAYMDGELSEFETVKVEYHLRGCAHCADELQLLRSTAALLADLEEVAVPAGFRAGLRARLESLPAPAVAAAVQPGRRPLSLWRRWGMPAAAAVAAISTFLITYQPRVPWPATGFHGPDEPAPVASPFRSLIPPIFTPTPAQPEPGSDAGTPDPAAGVVAAVEPTGPAVPAAPPVAAPDGTEGGAPAGPEPDQTPATPQTGGPPAVPDPGGGTVTEQPEASGVDPSQAQVAAALPGEPQSGAQAGEVVHLQYAVDLYVADVETAVAMLEQETQATGGKVVGRRNLTTGGRTATEVTLEVPAAGAGDTVRQLAAAGTVIGTLAPPERFDRTAELTRQRSELDGLRSEAGNLRRQLDDPETTGNLRLVYESDLKRIEQQIAILEQESDLLLQSAHTATVVVTLQSR